MTSESATVIQVDDTRAPAVAAPAPAPAAGAAAASSSYATAPTSSSAAEPAAAAAVAPRKTTTGGRGLPFLLRSGPEGFHILDYQVVLTVVIVVLLYLIISAFCGGLSLSSCRS